MSYNLKYTPEYTNKKNNIFLEEFFTGTDTKIYVDGKECDFIASMSYSIQEKVYPLFGYASYVFDSVATGIRTIGGNILIPIKNYDTEIYDFTKEKVDEYHPVIQKEKAYLPGNEWLDKPYWVDYESEKREKEASAKVIVRTLTSTIADENKGKINSKTVEGGRDATVTPKSDPDQITCKKPKSSCISSPYFMNSYSDDMFVHDFIQGKLKYNHKDFLVKMNGKDRKVIKGVVFTGSEVVYASNDEAIYESITFLAKDVIDLDGAKIPEKEETVQTDCEAESNKEEDENK